MALVILVMKRFDLLTGFMKRVSLFGRFYSYYLSREAIIVMLKYGNS